jgi:hypothetical protein
MKGVATTSGDRIAVLRAIALGRQRGLADSSNVLDQILDQLHAAQAEHRVLLAELKAEFDSAIAELQRELDAARHELRKLRELDALARWVPDTTFN